MTKQYTVLTAEARYENAAARTENLKTEYIIFAGKGDQFPEEDLQYACEYAKEQHLDAVMMTCRYHIKKKNVPAGWFIWISRESWSHYPMIMKR